MAEFLKMAFEVVAQIINNLVAFFISFFKAIIKVFDIPGYGTILEPYFVNAGIAGKFFAVVLAVLLIAIPVALIVLLIRHIILNIQLKADGADNAVLYREIGRLNKQVLELMDEKNKILDLKANAVGTDIPYVGRAALDEDGMPTVNALMNGGAAAVVSPALGDPLATGTAVSGAAVPVAGAVGVAGTANIGEDAISQAAVAAATAAAEAKVKSEEKEKAAANRFAKLSLVDLKYQDYQEPEFDDSITLEQFVQDYRLFAASQLHLYYTPEIVRRFVAGMASSQILILEGISGTGKTSLPYSFSRYLGNPATIVSVQPSYRDRTELLGYFNEFSKRFNETEFLRALYEAGYRKEPTYIVLDEMNLARIEYYFAEMLSILEMPSHDEWVVDLVPTAWPGDPEKMEGGKIHISPNTWFVGTANSDDSTFTITDKVYDRAMPIELNERAEPFECPLQPKVTVSCDHLRALFEDACQKYPISEATLSKMMKLNEYLMTRFKLSFGNRIMKQMNLFIPVYVACGGTELGALDYIIARKVLKKFESLNVTFVRDEIKGLMQYMEKTFGKSEMKDSQAYLARIQNFY